MYVSDSRPNRTPDLTEGFSSRRELELDYGGEGQ